MIDRATQTVPDRVKSFFVGLNSLLHPVKGDCSAEQSVYMYSKRREAHKVRIIMNHKDSVSKSLS